MVKRFSISKIKLNFIFNVLNIFNSPLRVFFISFVIYTIFSFVYIKPVLSPSSYPYFNYLADAFLHGQFHFRIAPPTTHDLVLYNSKIYAYWPPFPAILMMPFVAIFGVNFSDIFFTLLLGSINVGLLSYLLTKLDKKNILSLDPIKRSFLVIFFAFGTVYVTMVPLGRVWFTALVVGVFCILFTFLAAVKFEGFWGFFLAGIGVSAAFTTRMHLVLAAIWPAWYLIHKNWKKPKLVLMRQIIVGLTPLVLTGLFIFYYNYARFGNILDVGLDYHQMGEIFQDEYKQFGAFNLYYLPKNFYYQFFAYPFLSRNAMNFFMGGSLFLLSPLFFAIFWALKSKTQFASKIVLSISIFLTNIPILLLMGTGWVQFGPRYSLDFVVPMLILTGMGIKKWPNRVIALLVLISIIHYFVGLYLLSISMTI